MKNSRFYLLAALFMAVVLAAVAGCTKPPAATQPPAAPASPSTPGVVTPPSTPAAAGTPDLVVTKVWLDGLTVKCTVKNIGTGDSPQTYAQIRVNGLVPTLGSDGFLDSLKPGESRDMAFTNYQWPYNQAAGEDLKSPKVNPAGYIEPLLKSQNILVCADIKNTAAELVETNNCKLTIIGPLWDFDFLQVSNLANWRNNDGNYPEPGSEGNVNGAHFKIANVDMEAVPQLEVIPKQVPDGWMQGTWGYFYGDEYGSPKIAAYRIPAKLHFIGKAGLSRNATGSDGVTLKFGVKDLNDKVTWLATKKATAPGVMEAWDVDLSGYEGEKLYFVLLAEAGASPVNDFVIWNQAKVTQVND